MPSPSSSFNSPMPSVGAPLAPLAPLATLVSQSNVINCAGTTCGWESPSASDRSDPKSTMVCPVTKSIRVWRDKNNSSEPRDFKCVSSTTSNSAQTDECHISELGKPAAGWPANKPYATAWKESCKNTWFRY